MVSKFLPPSYDAKRPIVVIAGKALYPKLTLSSIRRHRLPVRLIAFDGETREDVIASFPPHEAAVIKVGQLGKMLKTMDQFQAGYAIMVGQVTPRRLFQGLHPDLKALRLLTTLKEKNAETIFGKICGEIGKLGLQMLDARAFLDHELATVGLMTGGKLKVDFNSMEHGVKIAKEVARLNIGQSVVVRKGTVIAVEAFEGTDEMLRRAGGFQTDQLIFLKTVKPGQDFRFDVPCFGIKTLIVMREANISLACLEADCTIILEKEKVLQQAAQWGIQLYGYS